MSATFSVLAPPSPSSSHFHGVFMTNNTPSGAKKHRKSTEPRSRQTAKMFFFFFFFFRRASSKLHDSFTTVFTQNRSIFTEQCTSLSLFSRCEVTRGDSNRSLKNYGFLYDAIFSSRVRMRTNHLATKCNYYVRLPN